jgi:cytochrome c oxidase assembly factor CtaG
VSVLFSPPVLGVAAAAVLYWRGSRRRLRAVDSHRRVLRRWRAVAFAAALATVLVALTGPIDRLADDLFWVHMLQHVLLVMVAAPLLVLAAPWHELWRPLPLGLRRGVAKPVARRSWAAPIRWAGAGLARPIPAWIAFNLNLLIWHWPPLYDLALRNEWVHDIEHLLFLGTAVLFWAQVWDSPPLRARLSPFGRVVYVTAATVPAWLLALVLAMASTPLYPAYAGDAGRPWGISALTDQQLAAGVMWGPGGIPFSVAVFLGIYRWLQTEGQVAPPRRARLAGRR